MRPLLNRLGLALLVVVLVAGASVAQASTIVLDDFNRPDSGTLGSNWTQRAGACAIAGNQADCSLAGLATYNGGSGSEVSADVFSSGTLADYVALVLGYADLNNNLFIKLQNQDGVAGFDSIGFYFGNNGFGNPSWPGFVFLQSVLPNIAAAHVNLSLIGTDVHLDIDSNFDTVYDFSFVRNNVPLALLGSGIGIGGFGAGLSTLDNFGGVAAAPIPEPASIVLLGVSLLSVGVNRWRRL
jgi:hypothetical protein